MDNQFLKMKGTMIADLHKADGTVETTIQDNIIVNVGFDLICDCIGKSASRPAVVSHIAVGTLNTAENATQTTLATEVNRQAATYAHTVSTKIFSMQATFGAGVATGALVEAGVFNAASSGTMLDRVVFPVINKGASDSLVVTFTFTLT